MYEEFGSSIHLMSNARGIIFRDRIRHRNRVASVLNICARDWTGVLCREEGNAVLSTIARAVTMAQTVCARRSTDIKSSCSFPIRLYPKFVFIRPNLTRHNHDWNKGLTGEEI
jgi:hypothetical protein